MTLLSTSPSIELLLATFNGARYLTEQLDSLLAQDYREFRIVISDDGSSDATTAIIDRYVGRYPASIRTLRPVPRHLGADRNFARLLDAASADYVFFCDQDDVWLPDKISRTLAVMDKAERLSKSNHPLLVHTDLTVVDAQLRELSLSFMLYTGISPSRTSFSSLLFGNVVTGCTVMANRSLYELARPIPEAMMFDHWLAQVAAGMGTIAYLDAPTVLYRQHDSNAVGARPVRISSFAERVKVALLSDTVLRVLSRYSQHASALTARYARQLDPKDTRQAQTLADIWYQPRLTRVIAVVLCGLFRTSIMKNFGIMLLLLRDGRPERFKCPD